MTAEKDEGGIPPHIQEMIDRYGVPPYHCGYDDLTALIRGQLSEEGRALVEGHLAGCPECRKDLDDFRKLLDPEFASKVAAS